MDRNYECMLIFKPDLSDAERKEAVEGITGKIKELEGDLSNSRLWAKTRDLHFFLKSKGAERKKYYQGSYWLLQFVLATEKLDELKETIRLEERVLRSLVLNKEDDKLQVKEAQEKLAESEAD